MFSPLSVLENVSIAAVGSPRSTYRHNAGCTGVDVMTQCGLIRLPDTAVRDVVGGCESPSVCIVGTFLN